MEKSTPITSEAEAIENVRAFLKSNLPDYPKDMIFTFVPAHGKKQCIVVVTTKSGIKLFEASSGTNGIGVMKVFSLTDPNEYRLW